MGRGPPILCEFPKLAIKQKPFQTENVDDSIAVCADPARGISRDTSQQRIIHHVGDPKYSNRDFIIPTCPVKSQCGVIIHTGLVTAVQVA